MGSWNAQARTGTEGHAYNKTLLARLGFGDEDRRNSLHDQACQFLVRPEVVQQLLKTLLARVVVSQKLTRQVCRGYSSAVAVEYRLKDFRWTEARTEQTVVKGKDQYKTTIGFLDVSLMFVSLWEPLTTSQEANYSETHSFAIEVKAGKVPVSEVIRQINLYREFVSFDTWLLATPWPISEVEKTTLDGEKIKHILLGDSFREFVAQNEKSPEAQSDVIL
jgi:hypothetical protein